MRKLFVALIAIVALTLAAVTLAGVSPTKQKADAVAQASIGQNVASADVEVLVAVDSTTEARAPAIREVGTLEQKQAFKPAQPLKPDSSSEYGDGNRRTTSNSYGFRSSALVLIV